MRARSIAFTHNVRTGPATTDRKDALVLSDQHFGRYGSYECGVIEVDVKNRLVTITCTRLDKVTNEPIVSVVPFDRVVSWEPLSDAQAKVFYGPRAEAA